MTESVNFPEFIVGQRVRARYDHSFPDRAIPIRANTGATITHPPALGGGTVGVVFDGEYIVRGISILGLEGESTTPYKGKPTTSPPPPPPLIQP
jgi:hypothetical protein